MNALGKPIAIALTLSILFVIFNIYAVTQGTADETYSQVDVLIKNLIQW